MTYNIISIKLGPVVFSIDINAEIPSSAHRDSDKQASIMEPSAARLSRNSNAQRGVYGSTTDTLETSLSNTGQDLRMQTRFGCAKTSTC